MNERNYFMSLLDYSPSTGIFKWKVDRRRKCIGQKAGGESTSRGYQRIKIDQKRYYSHRLAWLFVYGQWPGNEIDHINGIRNDNRIDNLRDVSHRANHINRVVHRNGKLPGASYSNKERKAKQWEVQIRLPNGKTGYFGYYKTEQEAHETYMKAFNEIEKEEAV